MQNKTQWWRAPATSQRHWWCSDRWLTRHLPTPTPLWQLSCTSKDSGFLWHAVHPRLSRPSIVSDYMPSAIERHWALDRPHTSPRHDAHSHERTRIGLAKAVRLTPNSFLPCQKAILHNTTNKSPLNGYPPQYNIQLVNKLDCIVTHAEADITLSSYMLRRTEPCQSASSVTTPTYSSFWCTRQRWCGSLPTSKWRSGMAISWTSVKSLSS